MKRTRKYLLIALGVVMVLVAIGYFYLSQPRLADDRRTIAERQQIADACFAMLHSSLTNEGSIKMDDPRIPEVIRALHPVGIIVDADFAVQVDCNGRPAEYVLMRLPHHRDEWVLGAAGPPIHFGPRPVLMIKHD